MKKLFIVTQLLLTTCLFAQSSPSLALQKPTPTFLLAKPSPFSTPTFVFSPLQFYTKADFSIYNKTTQFNDNYSVYNGKMEYKNSIIIPENLVFNTKIDSFNPNGADSIEGALFSGAINLFADLFNGK